MFFDRRTLAAIRTLASIGAGLRRILHKRHVAFYRIEPEGVLILDIIGADQLPEKHLQPDQ